MTLRQLIDKLFSGDKKKASKSIVTLKGTQPDESQVWNIIDNEVKELKNGDYVILNRTTKIVKKPK